MTTRTNQTQQLPTMRGNPLLGCFTEFQHRRLAFFERFTRECGPIGSFRVGPVRLALATSAETIHECLVEKLDDFEMGDRAKAIAPFIGDNALLVIDGPRHRQQRRLVAPAFQHKRIMQAASDVVALSDEHQRGWREGAQLLIDHEMQRLIQYITRKVLFGVTSHEGMEEFSRAIEFAAVYAEYLASRILPIPLSWPTPMNRRAHEAISVMRSTVRKFISQGRARQTDSGDFLSMLLLARDEDGTVLSDEQVLDQALTMYSAGQETTATALTWFFILLAKHPEVRAKVQSEIDTVLQGRPPVFSDLANLPYTLQVAKETLRLYPPVYVTGRSAIRDTELGGYPIKKGQYVLLCIYAAHRDPRFYPDPDQFRPERFALHEEQRRPRSAFHPFGAGPHTCIGNHFALMEMHLVAAHLTQNVTLELVPGQNLAAVPNIILKPSATKMIVRRRFNA